MYRISQKLDFIKKESKGWSRVTFGDFFKTKKMIKDKLEGVQNLMARGSLLQHLHEEEETWRRKWKDLLSKEEIFWK